LSGKCIYDGNRPETRGSDPETKDFLKFAETMLSLATVLSLAGLGSTACTRSFLKAATDDYIVAQSSGQPSGVTAFSSPNLTYTENNVALDINKGTIAKPLKLDYNFSAHDTVECATVTELVAASDPHPHVIHT
jgi:hypothetical protein